MYYINTQTGEYPLTESDIKQRHRDVSFPIPFEPLAEYKPVKVVARPTVDYTQNISETKPVEENGLFQQQWFIAEATDGEKAERTEQQASIIRTQRNIKLSETDWRVTYEVEKAAVDGLGIQFPAVWSTYRQALRDITTQPGFPHNVTWPTEPST